MYTIVFSRLAQKDKSFLKQAGLEDKARAILNVLIVDPHQTPPTYEKLQGDLKGYYSRRINRQHRMIYRINETEKIIHIARMWTHYE